MPLTAVQLAEASYHRCSENLAFYETFYTLLLASDPRIPPMFAETQFERQHRLLKHALGLLVIYAKRPNPALLDRIAQRHSKTDVGVPPDMYPCFVESLVEAVRRHDPAFTPEIGAAWRAALEPGIAFIQSRYEGAEA